MNPASASHLAARRIVFSTGPLFREQQRRQKRFGDAEEEEETGVCESQLEQQLKEYLGLKKRRAALEQVLYKPSGAPRVSHIIVGREDVPAKALGLTRRKRNSEWAEGPDEAWAEVTAASGQAAPAFTPDAVKGGGESLRNVIIKRRRSTDLLRVEPDEVIRDVSLHAAVQRLWTGCRPYPYTVDQLEMALSALVQLRRGLADYPLDQGLDPGPFAAKLMADAVEIEFGRVDICPLERMCALSTCGQL